MPVISPRRDRSKWRRLSNLRRFCREQSVIEPCFELINFVRRWRSGVLNRLVVLIAATALNGIVAAHGET